jgi:hypothetical protein
METFYPASLMTEGIVISLKILVIGIGDRGSKSEMHLFGGIYNYISVKEQRVDGSSVIYIL